MMTWPTSASAPSRSAMLASTSAVQQMIGADAFTLASPVIMPTFLAPNVSIRAKNFSDNRALIGAHFTALANGQNDVGSRHHLDEGFLLMGVQAQALALGPFGERVVDRV